MKSLKQIITISLAALTLTACSGDDQGEVSVDISDRISGGGSSNGGPTANISGSFKNAHETGVFFSAESLGYLRDEYMGINSYDCQSSYADHYYETENTLIYGNPNLPESDFQHAANWIENNFSTALNAMGITKDEYFSLRGNVRLAALDSLQFQLYALDKGENYGTFMIPEQYGSSGYMTSEERTKWSYEAIYKATSADVVETLLSEPNGPRFTAENQILVEDKLYVCLHEKDSPWGWGEGHSLGVNIGAASVYTPNQVEQLIRHELIHTIQHALAGFVDWLPTPRWFSEGQAVYLSGMEVAHKSKHSEYEPTSVVTFWDEYGDPSDAYKHYGLAYQYLVEANGHDKLINMMKQLKGTSNWRLQWNIPEQQKYVEVFDSLNMLKADGTSLTVEDYRLNYQSIMSDYASN
ncbi:hypothetical protein D210916BOD24_23400 [Alteromonas sp. D210916BOD_24]|uniref:hypothetical protein n=1 Tax=Alteromonas sp. D210916BOD_24 TaxID=3157618 RepID=UPI00399C7B7F